jgi:hypothetical protein
MRNKKRKTNEIIEDRYLTLIRYLRLLIKEKRLDAKNVECFLNALDDEEIVIEEIVEETEN